METSKTDRLNLLDAADALVNAGDFTTAFGLSDNMNDAFQGTESAWNYRTFTRSLISDPSGESRAGVPHVDMLRSFISDLRSIASAA